jgi:hypothetical protein
MEAWNLVMKKLFRKCLECTDETQNVWDLTLIQCAYNSYYIHNQRHIRSTDLAEGKKKLVIFSSYGLFYLITLVAEDFCLTWKHPMTHSHSVGLLWARDRPVVETSTWHITTLRRERRPNPQRDSSPPSQQSSGLRLRFQNARSSSLGN